MTALMAYRRVEEVNRHTVHFHSSDAGTCRPIRGQLSVATLQRN